MPQVRTKQTKERNVRFRLTEEEWEKAVEIAENRCQTVSELLRDLLRQQWSKTG